MIEIIKVRDTLVTSEVDQMPDQEPELQVPDISRDPARSRQHIRRLMAEEDRRAAEEEQPIADTINTVCLMVCSMVFGMILAMAV